MDEGLTHRNEDLEIEISDAIAAIDDLKTSCVTMEENIVNNTNENFEVSHCNVVSTSKCNCF